MTLNIGRKGWAGIALESTFKAPTTPADYVAFQDNSLHGVVDNANIDSAYGVREQVFSSVPIKKQGEGDLSILLDAKISGYFLIAALGSVQDATIQSGVYTHIITCNNSNTPQSLSIVNYRTIDREAFYGASINTLNLAVGDGIATLKASILSAFPQTTTSGTLTTASGGVYGMKDAKFGFGGDVAAADAAALGSNLKLSDFSLDLNNNSEAIHRHGNIDIDTINHGEFQAEGEFTVYFENTTDRDSYYNSSKQAGELYFAGAGLAGGYNEYVKLRFYQLRLDTFELETGLANFYAEKVKFVCEYDNANSASVDAVLQNAKSAY